MVKSSVGPTWDVHRSMQNIYESEHLSSGLDALPDAKVADDPRQDETQDQFPPQAAHLINTTWDL